MVLVLWLERGRKEKQWGSARTQDEAHINIFQSKRVGNCHTPLGLLTFPGNIPTILVNRCLPFPRFPCKVPPLLLYLHQGSPLGLYLHQVAPKPREVVVVARQAENEVNAAQSCLDRVPLWRWLKVVRTYIYTARC